MRFGLARRLLAAFEGVDIPPPALAKRLLTDKKQVYRWESGENLPRDQTARELASLCQRAGVPITVGWLERGESDLPPIVIPSSALSPVAVAEERAPAHVTPANRKRKAAPRPSQTVQARKSAGSK